MNTTIKKFSALTLASVFVMQLAACGTILYPERKGQRGGRLDPSIVALNAVGLLFFLVPGVIAFAVDFNNGAIYLPGGSASIHSGDINVVNIEGELTNEKIEQVIFQETGKAVHLSESNVVKTNKPLTVSLLQKDVRFL